MTQEMIFLAGGAALAIIVVALILHNAKSNGKKGSEIISDSMDEQLVVENLNSSDLTSWFKSKNADGKNTNVIMYLSKEAISTLKMSQKSKQDLIDLLEDSDKIILQAIVSKNDDAQIIISRAVIFNSIAEGLESLLNENNGVLIVE